MCIRDRSYSEQVAAEIDQEVKRIIGAAYKRCEEILTRDREKLERVARYLLEHEVMESEAFEAVYQALPEADPS